MGIPRLREATHPTDVGCFEILHDRTELGQKLKFLRVLDEYTRECLEIRWRNTGTVGLCWKPWTS